MRKFLTRLKLYVFLTSSLVISCTADSCHHLKVLSPLCKLERLSWVCIRYFEFTFWLQGNLMVSWKSFSGQHCYSSNPSKHQSWLKQSETNKYRQINPKSSRFASNWANEMFLKLKQQEQYIWSNQETRSQMAQKLRKMNNGHVATNGEGWNCEPRIHPVPGQSSVHPTCAKFGDASPNLHE